MVLELVLGSHSEFGMVGENLEPQSETEKALATLLDPEMEMEKELGFELVSLKEQSKEE